MENDHVIIAGVGCLQCGHTLPESVFRQFIGPWCPDELTAAARGVLHPLNCSACGTEGRLRLPVACAFVDVERIVLYLPQTDFLPQRLALRDKLLQGLALRLGGIDRFQVQVARHETDIPELLTVHPLLVASSDYFSTGYLERLMLHPRDKAAARVAQLFAFEQLFEAHEKRSEKIYLKTPRTPFELSPTGRSLLKAHLEVVAVNTHWQRQVVVMLARQCEDQAADALPEDFDLLWRFVAAWLNSPPDDRTGSGELLAHWAHMLCSLGAPGVAADLCEGYFLRSQTTERRVAEHVHCAVAYAKALYSLPFASTIQQIQSCLLFALQYLPESDALPPTDEDADVPPDPNAIPVGNIAFLSAFAHELAGICHEHLGQTSDALTRLLEAGALYRRTQRQDGLAHVLARALPLAKVLGERDAYEQLESWLIELPPELLTEPVLQAHARVKHATGTRQVRKLTHVCTDWSSAILSEEERERANTRSMRVAPFNMRLAEGQPLPADAIVDVEIETPFDESEWQVLCQSAGFTHCEVLVLRRCVVEQRHLRLVEERVIIHPVMDWIRQTEDQKELVRRLGTHGDVVWDWAATEGHGFWLFTMLGTLEKWLGPLDAWPVSVRSGYGMALARSELQRSQGDKPSMEVVQAAHSLLEGLISLSPDVNTEHVWVESGVFTVRSLLARLDECLGRFDDAARNLQRNIDEGFLLRHRASAITHQRSLQTLIGRDAMRLNRVRLRRQRGSEVEAAERIAMFETIESTRCRVLLDRLAQSAPVGAQNNHVLHFGSRYSLDFVARARSHDRYIQLSLVSGQDEFTAVWLAMSGSPTSAPDLTFLAFEQPYAQFKAVEKVLSDSRSDPAAMERLNQPLKDFVHWTEKVVPFSTSGPTYVGAAEYLLMLPWSFAGAVREPPLAIVNVFSGAVAPQLDRASHIRPGTLRVFLDPLSDLPEIHDLESALLTSPLGATSCSVRTEQNATRAAFIRESAQADLLIYIGHGARRDESSCLLFSIGQQLSPADLDLQPLPVASGASGVRVAIVLACWGGLLNLQQARHNWEADGLAYRLRARGFDYVITALWPITPQVAQAFVGAFMQHASQLSVPNAFVAAYRTLVSKIGIDAAYRDGACIQLIG